jgi:hypothetical protein
MTDFAHPALLVVAALAPLASLALLLVRRRQGPGAHRVAPPVLDGAAVTLARLTLLPPGCAAAPPPRATSTSLLDVSGSMGRPTGGGHPDCRR